MALRWAGVLKRMHDMGINYAGRVDEAVRRGGNGTMGDVVAW